MAKPSRKSRDPFDVTLSEDARQELTLWIVDELQNAMDARASAQVECDYWHRLYEQGRTRSTNAPWANAADLTSYLATQNVDALQARLMKTINVEPMWTVEGWGAGADRAPIVEDFHQWKSEEEGLQSILDRLSLISLIEPRGLLEVREGTEMRRVRKKTWVAMDTVEMPDPATGLMDRVPVFDEQGAAKLRMGEDGKYVEPTDPSQPAVEVVVDSLEPVRVGPQYRILPYRDSLVLPGHARDKDEIWGYAKRFWKRIPDLQKAAKAGLYDADAVESLTTVGDREPDPALQRSGMTIANQEGHTAEKELWEVLLLKDLDGKGERWYLVTVSILQHVLLRVQHDDIDRSRFVLFNLFPRPDRVTEGFSLVGHKLITTIEEHTAVRNMRADRSSMAAQAPIKRLLGALWDPLEQPWGASAVIDVRDMRELEPVVVSDVPASVVDWARDCERIAERLVGVNDIATGQTVQSSAKTLGEVQMATEQSFVRMDLVIRRFQESMEDLAAIRHAIWKRVLAEQPEGVEPPQGILVGLEARGLSLPGGRMTAGLLDGQFRFKPRGSVETADPRALRADFNQMLQALPVLLQVFPLLQQALTMNPQAARALLEQFVRVYRIPNRQAFLSGAAMIQQQMQQMQQAQQLQQQQAQLQQQQAQTQQGMEQMKMLGAANEAMAPAGL
jgi:hypothetical protein